MRVVVSGVFVGDSYERPGGRCKGRIQMARIHTVRALPVFAWQVSFAVWLIAKGLGPSSITAVRSADVEGRTPLPLG
jgi:hypothetical protein